MGITKYFRYVLIFSLLFNLSIETRANIITSDIVENFRIYFEKINRLRDDELLLQKNIGNSKLSEKDVYCSLNTSQVYDHISEPTKLIIILLYLSENMKDKIDELVVNYQLEAAIKNYESGVKLFDRRIEYVSEICRPQILQNIIQLRDVSRSISIDIDKIKAKFKSPQ